MSFSRIFFRCIETLRAKAYHYFQDVNRLGFGLWFYIFRVCIIRLLMSVVFYVNFVFSYLLNLDGVNWVTAPVYSACRAAMVRLAFVSTVILL